MPGFYDPLWLAWLGIIPVIRWLHRWHAPLSAWPVSAIFLWQHATQEDAPGRTKKPPDPVWRRRALLVAFLICALANPYWKSESALLTVWVDDSLSMLAVENGSTRLETVLATLARELDESDASWAEIELSSLSDPERVRQISGSFAADPGDWQSGPLLEPTGPPGPLMSDASSHWLLTDGASEGVRSWARRVGIERLLQTGSATENSAVSHLAARRNLAVATDLDVLVSISNSGLESDARRIALYSGGQLLAFSDLSLPAGQTLHWQPQVVAGDLPLTARLSAGDVLRRDDELTLSVERFVPLATVVEASCGAALRRAIATHPSLRISRTETRPALSVSCPRDNFPEPVMTSSISARARVRVLNAAPRLAVTTPTWMPYAGDRSNLALSAAWLSAAQWPDRAGSAKDRVLLASADMPLVVLRDQDAESARSSDAVRFVDTIVDMGQPLFVRQPEYAGFVGALVDLATGRQLLSESVSVSRDPLASRVIPVTVDTHGGRAALQTRDADIPFSFMFVLAALLLLMLDTGLYVRTRRGAKYA